MQLSSSNVILYGQTALELLRQLVPLLIGTFLVAPLGVWVLKAFPPSLLKRLIGLILMGVVVIEWYGAYLAAGIRLFDRVDQLRFRRLMFALLFVLGLAMCVRG